MTRYQVTLDVFALAGVVAFTYYTARHGLPWVWHKIRALFWHARDEVLELEGRVKVLELYVHDHLTNHAPPATGS